MEKSKAVRKTKEKIAMLATYLLDTEINVLVDRHGVEILRIFRALCIVGITTSVIGISWSLGSIAKNSNEINLCSPNKEIIRR